MHCLRRENCTIETSTACEDHKRNNKFIRINKHEYYTHLHISYEKNFRTLNFSRRLYKNIRSNPFPFLIIIIIIPNPRVSNPLKNSFDDSPRTKSQIFQMFHRGINF